MEVLMNMEQAMDYLLETSVILRDAISQHNEDKSQEAVTILLTQALDFFGQDNPVMAQLFPVFNEIKKRLDADNWEGALSQTDTWISQINEVKELVSQREQ